jgi:integrase
MRGHIRRRGQKSWELKFDVGRDPVTGRRKIRYQSFKGTKIQAEAELARSLARANDGNYVDPAKTTLTEFLDRWVRDWAMANVSPKTLERYRGLIDNQIRPHLGHIQIQKLRPVHLNELYSKLLRVGGIDRADPAKHRGLSARTVGHVHRILHRALGHAAQWDVVQQNVADNVSPPRVEAAEIKILTQDQVDATLKRLSASTLYPIVLLALATGIRRGEILALRWQDVDIDNARLRVERSLEETRAEGLRFKSPETKHGRRTICLPAAAAAELRKHRKAQQEQRLALGLGKAPADALVFPTWEGRARHPDSLSKEFTAAMFSIGLSVTLHALRHTHASQLIAGGVDVLTISRRLGHGSPAITLSVYGHLFSNTDDRAARVTEAAFSRGRTE